MQHIVQFENMLRIPLNQAMVMKYGKEYCAFIKCKEYLQERFDILAFKPYCEYTPNGVTQEDLFGMFINHDENILQKKSHPQTASQLQQQAKGKKKQQEAQAQKKKGANPITKSDDNKNVNENTI